MNSPADTAVIVSTTIQGVVQRLQGGGLIATKHHPPDRRRRIVELTARGRETVQAAAAKAKISNEETLAPLTATERKTLIHLLGRLSN